MKEGRERPDRHTLNPHPMPLRSTGRSALLLLIASPLLLSAAPQDLRDFDDFIRHVRTEAGSGHPERIADCFAPIVAEDGCEPVPFGDAFVATRSGSAGPRSAATLPGLPMDLPS